MDGEGEPRVDVCLDVTEATEAASITPSQQKKLRKMQEREEMKPVQRQWQRQKKKERRLEARLAGKDLGREKREANAREKHVNPARVIIDLSFDDFMTDKEVGSMSQQLTSLYNSNRMASHPFSSIIFCGPPDQSLLHTAIGMRMETNMRGHWHRWQSIQLCETGGLERMREDMSSEGMGKEQLVYLTADSDRTLEAIEEDKAYIIGGLVDRNRHKRLCADKADRLGIQTARLPIPPGLLTTSSVLTVNMVVEILLSFNETRDWAVTLDKCLPKRKRAGHTGAKPACEGETEPGSKQAGSGEEP